MLCEYKCGQEAKFITASGKNSCSQNGNHCPAVKKNRSDKLEKAHANGTRNSNQFDGKRNWNKGKHFAEFTYGAKGNHKGALIAERGHRCESCLLDAWLDKPITLELEHIDGDTKNNVRENLKLLCPNCHAQTPTWRRRKTPGTGRKYSEEVMADAIIASENMQQALDKLDLKWGSSATLMKVKDKLELKFKTPGG